MHQDLAVGKVLDLNINTNQKNYCFYAKVVEKKEIEVGGKVFEAYLIKGSARRRDKNSLHTTEFSIWFLNKPFKIPLLVKSFTNIGPIIARLARLE